MVTVATKLFERTEVVAQMAEKFASEIKKLAAVSEYDIEEIKSRARDMLSEEIDKYEMEREKDPRKPRIRMDAPLSIHSIENDALMEQLVPIMRRVAEQITRPIDPARPELGYAYTRGDGRLVNVTRKEVWMAINEALQSAMSPGMAIAATKTIVKTSGFKE